MAKTPKKNKSYLLCVLDKKYHLYVSSNAFVIKERMIKKNEETWVGKFFYASLADSLRGYVRHKMRTKATAKQVNGDVKELIKLVDNLHKYLQKFGSEFEHDLMERLKDPVEMHLLNNTLETTDA